jgi:hypothetical protein
MGRLMRWNEVVMSYLQRNHHAPLIQWCGTCGAEAFLSAGDLAMAEACLVETIRGLEGTGHRSRCVQPNVKLAELRLLQGRTEEAERLLQGSEDLPEATRAAVALHRLKGELAVAAALLLRRLNQIGDTVVDARHPRRVRFHDFTTSLHGMASGHPLRFGRCPSTKNRVSSCARASSARPTRSSRS